MVQGDFVAPHGHLGHISCCTSEQLRVLGLLTLVLDSLCDHLAEVRDPCCHVRLTSVVEPPHSVRKVNRD